MRILAVDDQEKILEYIEDLLLDISPDIEVVSRNSWSAVEKVLEKDSDFDLVLLDVVMPEVDGVKIYQNLKEDYGLGKKVVFMTGASLIGKVLERPHITKPFGEKEIVDLIMEYCPEDEIDRLLS